MPRPDGAAVRSKQKRKEKEIIEKGNSVKTDAFDISHTVRVRLLKIEVFSEERSDDDNK